jgi:site-specific recombinase XerD
MGLTIRNATVPAVQAFAAALVARGLSAASQARAIAAVKSLLNYAHRLGFTPFNAAPAVRLP